MSLPRAEKLALAVRKNVRDKYEDKKSDLESSVSKALLGVSWTVEADSLALWPYAEERYAKENFGGMIYEYFSRGASLLDRFKEATKQSINSLASSHVLSLEIDPSASYKYCNCDIKDGKLRIVVAPKGLGVNISDALNDGNVTKALNDASVSSGAKLSFVAEESLSKSWYPKAAEIEAKVKDILGQDVKLNPRLEENYAALKAESEKPGTQLIKHWEKNFGGSIHGYFNGLVTQLQAQKFAGDEMLQEGFFDVVSKAEIALRTVEKLTKGNWCESVIEEGVLYMQTTPPKWANNVHDAAVKIVDML